MHDIVILPIPLRTADTLLFPVTENHDNRQELFQYIK
jgi:hypothetical protein